MTFMPVLFPRKCPPNRVMRHFRRIGSLRKFAWFTLLPTPIQLGALPPPTLELQTGSRRRSRQLAANLSRKSSCVHQKTLIVGDHSLCTMMTGHTLLDREKVIE